MSYARKDTNVGGGWRVLDQYGGYFVVETDRMADHAVKLMNNAFGRGKTAKAVELCQVLNIR